MSFILDALKKSETDRQRQNGPALFEVRAAPPRDKLPVWAVGLGVLLAINLVIVAWVLLRRPASGEPTAQSAAAQSAAQQSGQAAYGPAGSGQMSGSQGQQQGWNPQGQGTQGQPGWSGSQGGQGMPPQGGVQGQGMQAQGVPQGQGQQGSAMGGANGNGPGGYGGGVNGGPGGYPAPGGGQAGYGAPASGTQPGGPIAQTAGMTAGQQAPANGQAYAGTQQPGAGTAQGGEKLNPDDYAPAADPVPQPFGNHVTRATSSGVPLYNDVTATTALPSLRLDLHVYAATPQERFVMINMHKLHEGDLMTAEGVRVESITPYGAVLSRNGTKFLLPRD